jgi:hypothetical protein
MSHVTFVFRQVRPKRFSSLCMFGAIRAPILRQDWHYLQTDQNELPLGVPSGASEMIFEPMVRLAQCVKISTVSK